MVPKALVPVRIAPVAKRRLAHVTDASERTSIVRALLDHVLDVLQASALDVVVLAPHALTLDGIEVWRDRTPRLNSAIDDAAARIGLPVLIVHADLPALSPADIDALLNSPADVVIGRARDGGTNALLLRRPIRCAFGPASALTHAQRARASGLRAQVIDRPGLALDLDDEAALSAWRGAASSRPRS